MRIERRRGEPFFSICVPQYNRTSFLLKAIESFDEQTLDDFEVCVSDDCSTDGRGEEIVSRLERSSMRFVYERRTANGRYDVNLRSAIALARGRYCLLMGNDDCLASPETLSRLHADLAAAAPSVALTNFEPYTGGPPVCRIRRAGEAGAGPGVAVARFRDFSFVSGVILEASSARSEATERWDGSEMYQVYLAARLIARGGRLFCIDRSEIRQGIRIEAETVDSFATKPREPIRWFAERILPLTRFGALVVDAVSPFVSGRDKDRLGESVFRQILLFTYPFWLMEYRRVRSWPAAVGVARGMRPRRLWGKAGLSVAARVRLGLLYALVTVAGLSMPLAVFDSLRGPLHGLAKSPGRGRIGS